MCNHMQCQQSSRCQYQGTDPAIPTLAEKDRALIGLLESKLAEAEAKLKKSLELGDAMAECFKWATPPEKEAWTEFRKEVKE